jgi:hypothetical protein
MGSLVSNDFLYFVAIVAGEQTGRPRRRLSALPVKSIIV